MPDKHGNIKGIAIPRIPWQEEEECDHDWRAYYGRGVKNQIPDAMVCNRCDARRPYGKLPDSRDA